MQTIKLLKRITKRKGKQDHEEFAAMVMAFRGKSKDVQNLLESYQDEAISYKEGYDHYSDLGLEVIVK